MCACTSEQVESLRTSRKSTIIQQERIRLSHDRILIIYDRIPRIYDRILIIYDRISVFHDRMHLNTAPHMHVLCLSLNQPVAGGKHALGSMLDALKHVNHFLLLQTRTTQIMQCNRAVSRMEAVRRSPSALLLHKTTLMTNHRQPELPKLLWQRAGSATRTSASSRSGCASSDAPGRSCRARSCGEAAHQR